MATLKIHHPWSFEKSYQVCAGLIEIYDDNGEKFEAFSLGGHLEIDSQEMFTVSTLESPASILAITGAKPIELLFVDEIKILLAERRAQRLGDFPSYDDRLVIADPSLLYASLLNALSQKMEHSHHKENDQIMQLLNFIHTERQRFQEDGFAPSVILALEDIL